MIVVDPHLLTIGDLLFGDADLGDELATSLQEEGTLKRLEDALERVPSPLRHLALERVGHVVAGALGLDVLGVLQEGWQKVDELRDAARSTRATPGSEELVDLATHRISSVHEPHVEVKLDGARVATLRIRLDLEAELHAVQAAIREGAIVALRSGRADLAADLSCEGIPVASAKRTLDLDLTLALGRGLVLDASG